jgi:hypothetical protein
MAGVNNIILGDGVFKIGTTAIALTRGGGSFSIEREYREIEADGDFGPIKGRIRKTRSVAKLTLNALEILPANINKFYPALTATSTTTTTTFTGAIDIIDANYNETVSWTGKTKAGKAVVITLDNALCLENVQWDLVDKEEVVPEITYTATYLDSARTVEPWKIEYAL